MSDLREYIEARTMPVTESGCWIWMNTLSPKGYGLVWSRKLLASRWAHRASWLAFRGAIPDGSYVLHRCDVPCCVNPDHLFLGSLLENNRDRDSKGRAAWMRDPEAWAEKSRHQMHRRHAESRSLDRPIFGKLTHEQIKEIRATKDTRALAEKFGVCRSTIWRARYGKNWSHIT
jgi:hypothetical protein